MFLLDKLKKTKTYIDPAGPKIGLGTYQHIGESGTKLISSALEMGYRLLDTADHYNNHREVGNAIKLSSVKRKDFWVCTKIWKDRLLPHEVNNDIQRFLNELRINYIDIVLIHWPNNKVNILDTFKALEDAKQSGFINSYGVSNFTIKHLKPLIKSEYNLKYNQVEFHPLLNQAELYDFCNSNSIKIMSHSSLAGGKCLKIQQVIDLAKEYNCSAPQIIYSWLINKGIIPIVGVQNNVHLKENFNSQFIKLKKEDYIILDSLKLPNYRHLVKDYSDFD